MARVAPCFARGATRLTCRDVVNGLRRQPLEGVAVCLLDCTDAVRLAWIEPRAASGTWRQHTREEVAGFLRAAARMRKSGTGMFRLAPPRSMPGQS